MTYRIIVLVAFALVATLASYSQTTEPKAPQEQKVTTPEPTTPKYKKPMKTPAYGVIITSIHGRPLEGDILSHNAVNVEFRKDGKTYYIDWDKLSKETIIEIRGRPFLKQVRTFYKDTVAWSIQAIKDYQKNKWGDGYKRNLQKIKEKSEAIDRYRYRMSMTTKEYYKNRSKVAYMPVKEYIKKLNDPNDLSYLNYMSSEMRVRNEGLRKDPNWGSYNKTISDMMPTLEKGMIPIKEDKGYTMETELFKKINFRPKTQIGPSCGLYSIYHLFQISCKQKGIPYPSINKLKSCYDLPHITPGAYAPSRFIILLPRIFPRNKVTIQWYTDTSPIAHELVKQQLRKNIPVLAAVPLKNRRQGHAAIIVGYHYKGGSLIYHWQDSNQLYKNKGIKYTNFQLVVPKFSIQIN